MNTTYVRCDSTDTCVREYGLTIIDDRSLIQRLTSEIAFVSHTLKHAWPEFKNNPFRFVRRVLKSSTQSATNVLTDPFSLAGFLVACGLVLCAILTTILTPQHRLVNESNENNKDIEIVQLTTYRPLIEVRESGSGIGSGTSGRVGFGSHKGEGSEPNLKKARGGGSSGNKQNQEVQRGKLFQVSEIPGIQTTVRNPALPAAGINLDPKLWNTLPVVQYGDSRSLMTNLSHGPGDGGNFGTATGSGIGEADGPGFGPGSKGNMGGDENSRGGGDIGGGRGNNPQTKDFVYRLNQVDQRARVLAKPEPQYTEEARRNQITGTVVLRVIFSSSGEVTNVSAIQVCHLG